jgi:hypothetical protein
MRRIIAATAIALLLLFVLALVWPKKPSAASIALDAKLAQLRSNGVPLTALEIAKVLPDPDAEHEASNLLHEALSAARGPAAGDIPFIGRGMPRRTEPFRESTLQSMRLYLSYSDSMLEKIPARLDGVWFAMGWTNGFTNLVHAPFVEIRKFMQTLAVKTLFEAELGNAGKSAEALRKGFSVTSTLNGDSLVSAMIRVACAGLMCDAAERSLNRTTFGEADLLELERRINVERIDHFEYTFMTERHMGMLLLDPMRQGHNFVNESAIERIIWRVQQLIRLEKKFYDDRDYLLYLNTLEELRSAHQLSGLPRLRRYEQLADFYVTNIQSQAGQVVWPGWKKAIRTATETKARLVALKAVLALERYRVARGNALPNTLEELVPQYLPSPPRDPMDEQPLRFKKLPRGYVVYSIGADGIDNSGVERGSLTNNYDVTITIERE